MTTIADRINSIESELEDLEFILTQYNRQNIPALDRLPERILRIQYKDCQLKYAYEILFALQIKHVRLLGSGASEEEQKASLDNIHKLNRLILIFLNLTAYNVS